MATATKAILWILVLQFLCFVSCFSQSVWDGTKNTDWYYGHESDETYTITTPEELAGLSYLVNTKVKTFAGKTINIGDDPTNPLVFDMANRTTWNPIGTSARPFCGSVNGNNCIIRNLKMTGSSDYRGVFGNVRSIGEIVDGELVVYEVIISNINVETATISGKNYVGGICGFITGYCNSDERDYRRTAEIRNCTFNGSITGSGLSNYVGGIVGSLNYGIIDGCSTAGSVKGSCYVGGIAGYFHSAVNRPDECNPILQKSTSSALIVAYDMTAGGIAGYANNANISYCVNGGNVNGSTIYNGGIVGQTKGIVAVGYCLNNGSVSKGGAISGSGGTMLYCYYDKQRNCVDGVSGSDDIAGKYVGLLTSEMTGVSPSGITGWNPVNWSFSEDFYPIPKPLETSNFAKLASAPIFLDGTENYKAVATNFRLSSYPTWTNGTWSFVSVSGSDAVVSATDGYAELTATVGNISKIVFVSRQNGGVLTIDSPADMKKFRNAVNGTLSNYKGYVSYSGYSDYSFLLTDDINISGASSWVAIGNATHPFCGHFDGNGKIITGLNVTTTGEYHGLFGYVTGTVKNLTVMGNVTGSKYVAGICGSLHSKYLQDKAEVSNCHFVGTVTTSVTKNDVYVGGIVGELVGYAKVSGCSATGHIYMASTSAQAKCVGGIVGRAEGLSTAPENYILIEKCINLANVDAYSSVGGIVGYTDEYVEVSNNLNCGNTSGQTHYVGGLIGGSHQNDIIRNNITTGTVYGKSSVIGACNHPDLCTIEKNYYDNQISVLSGLADLGLSRSDDSDSEDVAGSAEGLMTAELLDLDLSEWTGWEETEGYPIPSEFYKDSVANVAKSYVLFYETQKCDNILDDFTVADFNGLLWESADMKIVNVEPPIAIIGDSNGIDTLTVSMEHYNKNFIVSVKFHEDPLPIELLAFKASCKGKSVLVEWTTASERNNDYFIVERSDDAINFTEIARVAGAGNSIEQLDYNYTDYSAASGDNYYRLVQVDYDGTRTASEIVVASCREAEGEPEVLVFPNPFHNDLTIHMENFVGESVSIEVYDMLGRVVQQRTIAVDSNSEEINLQLGDLSNGTYNVRISTADFVVNRKVVKE
ncbi:MAG: T9SS type A sorting domain-containing protein [Bacteroidales bacterium]|nr:T9SS type A sorting domain-containing protein [Bacteroidales bacterium]